MLKTRERPGQQKNGEDEKEGDKERRRETRRRTIKGGG